MITSNNEYIIVISQVGCLMVLFCKEYNVESTKVLEAVVSGDTESEADVSIEVLQSHLMTLLVCFTIDNRKW